MTLTDKARDEEVLVTSSWLLDSGCTHHMMPDLSLFESLDETYSARVKLGNGEYIMVKGVGVAARKSS